jgi:hypothetical protein
MPADYKRIVITLYAGLCLFFIFSYVMNTNIDYSTRHLKLLGFLTIPVLIMAVMERTGARTFNIALALAAAVNVVYFVQLQIKLTGDRYTSVQYFTRNTDKPEQTDSLDLASYRQLIAIDKRYRESKQPVIYYIESNADVSLDIPAPCIMQTPVTPVTEKTFRGKGPDVVACISKRTLEQHPGILQQKFPDAGPFRELAETGRYRFFSNAP